MEKNRTELHAITSLPRHKKGDKAATHDCPQRPQNYGRDFRHDNCTTPKRRLGHRIEHGRRQRTTTREVTSNVADTGDKNIRKAGKRAGTEHGDRHRAKRVGRTGYVANDAKIGDERIERRQKWSQQQKLGLKHQMVFLLHAHPPFTNNFFQQRFYSTSLFASCVIKIGFYLRKLSSLPQIDETFTTPCRWSEHAVRVYCQYRDGTKASA